MDAKIRQIAQTVRFLHFFCNGKGLQPITNTSKKMCYEAICKIKSILAQELLELQEEEIQENEIIKQKYSQIFNEEISKLNFTSKY